MLSRKMAAAETADHSIMTRNPVEGISESGAGFKRE
jgi:hypothetical protein